MISHFFLCIEETMQTLHINSSPAKLLNSKLQKTLGLTTTPIAANIGVRRYKRSRKPKPKAAARQPNLSKAPSPITDSRLTITPNSKNSTKINESNLVKFPNLTAIQAPDTFEDTPKNNKSKTSHSKFYTPDSNQESATLPINSNLSIEDVHEIQPETEERNDDLSRSLEAAIEQIPEPHSGSVSNLNSLENSLNRTKDTNKTNDSAFTDHRNISNFTNKSKESDSLMSRIQNLLHVTQSKNESVNLDLVSEKLENLEKEQKYNQIDESLSNMDTEKRLIELKNLASIVDKQFSELLRATNLAEKEPNSNSKSKSQCQPNLPEGISPIAPVNNKTASSIPANSTSNKILEPKFESTLARSPIKRNDSISSLSVTISEREREIDALLNRIKQRNENLSQKVISLTNIESGLDISNEKPPRPTLSRGNSSLSQDSLGKKVGQILDTKVSKLDFNQLQEGAQILNNILTSARSHNSQSHSQKKAASEKTSKTGTSYSLQHRIDKHLSGDHIQQNTEFKAPNFACPSDSDASTYNSYRVQKQLEAFENSPMWKYVKGFLPGQKGGITTPNHLRNPSSILLSSETASQTTQPASESKNSQTSKKTFLTSTASPTPVKPEIKARTNQHDKKNITVSTISAGDISIPKKDLFKNDLNDSDFEQKIPAHIQETLAAMRHLNQQTTVSSSTVTDTSAISIKTQDQLMTESETTTTSLNNSYKIPSLGEFRSMTSDEQRKIISKLREIRQARRNKQGKYKSVPDISKSRSKSKSQVKLESSCNTTETTVSSEFLRPLEIGASFHGPLVKSYNVASTENTTTNTTLPTETTPEIKQEVVASKPPRPVKKIIHDQTLDTTDASEIIHIVHRSKKTGLEKSIKTVKSRATEMGDSFLQKSWAAAGQNELNSSTETIVVAKADPRPVKPSQAEESEAEPEPETPKFDPYDVKIPEPVAQPICWFDTLDGNMKPEESAVLDKKPIKETVNLQERFLLYNRPFISKSRARLRVLDLMRQDRQLDKIWNQQRENLKVDKENIEMNLGPVVNPNLKSTQDMLQENRGRSKSAINRDRQNKLRNLSPVLKTRREIWKTYGRDKNPNRSPSPVRKTNAKVEKKLQTLVQGHIRPINAKKMLKKSRKNWKNLPENKEKMLAAQRKALYATYRLNAKCFNTRIQEEVLGLREREM